MIHKSLSLQINRSTVGLFFYLDLDSSFGGDFKATSILTAVQTVLITAIVPQTVILLISIDVP